MVVNKDKMIKNFCASDTNEKMTACNLWIKHENDTYYLMNYATIIAWKYDYETLIHINSDKYSRTTSKNQSKIRYYAYDKIEYTPIDYWRGL